MAIKEMRATSFRSGLTMGTVVTLIYVVLLLISVLFTGLPDNQMLHLAIVIIVFVAYFTIGYFTDFDFEAAGAPLSMRRLRKRIDSATVYTVTLGPAMFVILNIPTGITYSATTSTLPGVACIILLSALFLVNLGNRWKFMGTDAAGEELIESFWPIAVILFIVFANGIMKGLTSLRVEDFLAFIGISVFAWLFGFFVDY